MAIAARPLPLLVYLLGLWPLLPGSMAVITACASPQTPLRRRMCVAFAVAVGCVFVVFHVGMIAVGNFWE